MFKQNNGLIRVFRTLLHSKQSSDGMLTLNTAVHTQMMQNAQVTQIHQLSWKTPKNSKFVWANHKLKLCEIAEKLKISAGSVFTILHERLSMRKLCSKWLLCLLTVDKNMSTIQSIVCNCFNTTKSFCINMWQWMKDGSTTSLQS